MQRREIVAIFVTMLLVAGGLGARERLGVLPALAAQSWAVQVGADVDTNNGIIANAYFPNALTVDAGDMVSWSFPAMVAHTVTFDNGTAPPLAVTGLVPDPATGIGDTSGAINPVNVSGSSAAFDPKRQMSSGVPLDPPDERTPFSLTFSQPGVYHYTCAIHGPAMDGTVTVLPAGSALPETPAAATARGKAELTDAVGGTAGFEQTFPPTDSGTIATPSVHNVTAGASAGLGISLLQFLNKDVTVRRGDTVVWTVSDPAEAHTITFLSGGTEPQFLAVTALAGGKVKAVFPANVFSPLGGTTYTGQGYLNSGFILNGQSFSARIDAPPGRYEYLCLLHAVGFPYNMKGSITVAP